MPKRKAAAPVQEQEQAGDGPSTSAPSGEPSKVVYLGHIPHGFYEKQLKEYFSQFGKVSKVRLSRSKKSGKSKHYAFLEFASAEVAAIASEAMDGYMLASQKLSSRVLGADEVHPDLFKGANRVFKKMPWAKIERERQNKELTAAEAERRQRRAVERDERRRRLIAQAGIDYEYEPLELPQKAKKTKFED